MTISNRNGLILSAMELVETFSKMLNTISWVWGGLAIDIYQNRILREHADIDYLTLNLHSCISRFSELFACDGWSVKRLENGDLRVSREDVKVHLGHVELSDRARWTHNGEQGSILFPSGWLVPEPVNFLDIKVHVVKWELQYVLIERPQLLNQEWKLRDKDVATREYLTSLHQENRLVPQNLFDQVYAIESQRS